MYLWLLLHLCNVLPMCSINSQVLYNHNLHPSVCINRIKWLQPRLKLTALHTNQGISNIHPFYTITQYNNHIRIMVSVQWWVRLTFMPILSQFSWTLTTLWIGSSRLEIFVKYCSSRILWCILCQMKKRKIGPTFKTSRWLHPCFPWGKGRQLVLIESQFSLHLWLSQG